MKQRTNSEKFEEQLIREENGDEYEGTLLSWVLLSDVYDMYEYIGV